MMSERRETLLKIENVSLAFGENMVLRDVNAEIKNVVRTDRPDIQQGQVVCLLGPSGIGKTQLFRIMAGLSSPTSGNVLLGPEGRLVKRGEVGVVFQNYPLFRHRTVLGNLTRAARKAGMNKNEAKERAMELLQRFNLAERANFYPSKLSGGQRQRVAIAQQIICSRHFLLMDEPYSGLDLLMKETVSELILQVATMHEFNTIIVTTHNIPDSVTIADTIWVLGLERDSSGNFMPGARIRKEIDLISRDLAWQPNIKSLPQFRDVVLEIENLFRDLK